MRVQTNPQTCDGVWGVMVTTWNGAECTFTKWFADADAAEAKAAELRSKA